MEAYSKKELQVMEKLYKDCHNDDYCFIQIPSHGYEKILMDYELLEIIEKFEEELIIYKIEVDPCNNVLMNTNKSFTLYIDKERVSNILGLPKPVRLLKGEVETKTLGKIKYQLGPSRYNPFYREIILWNVLPSPTEYFYDYETDDYINCPKGFDYPEFEEREKLTEENIDELSSILKWLGFIVSENAIKFVYTNWANYYNSEYVDDDNKTAVTSFYGCWPLNIIVNELPDYHDRETYKYPSDY